MVGEVGEMGVVGVGLMDGAAGSLSPHGRLGSGLAGSLSCVMPVPAVCMALFMYLQPNSITQADHRSYPSPPAPTWQWESRV